MNEFEEKRSNFHIDSSDSDRGSNLELWKKDIEEKIMVLQQSRGNTSAGEDPEPRRVAIHFILIKYHAEFIPKFNRNTLELRQ